MHLQVEGALLSAAGGPVANGDYPMAFRVYAGAVGGAALFQDFALGVTVANGHFVYTLGLDVTSPLDDALFVGNQAHYFGVQVGKDPELPRVALGYLPYASFATASASAAKASALECSGCLAGGQFAVGSVKGEALADGAVTTAKIAAGAVSAAQVAFNYANSDAKAGDALKALDLACTGCVGTADLADGAVSHAKLAAAAVGKDNVDATFVKDLDLVQKKALKDVAFTGAYADLTGGPDLSPYSKIADANAWGGPQNVGKGLLVAAAADPIVCDKNGIGSLYYNTVTKTLLLCDGTTYKTLAVVSDLGSQNNAGLSCKDILAKNAAAKDGLYYIKGGAGNIQVYCDMTSDGGGWTLVATAVDNSAFWNWNTYTAAVSAHNTTYGQPSLTSNYLLVLEQWKTLLSASGAESMLRLTVRTLGNVVTPLGYLKGVQMKGTHALTNPTTTYNKNFQAVGGAATAPCVINYTSDFEGTVTKPSFAPGDAGNGCGNTLGWWGSCGYAAFGNPDVIAGAGMVHACSLDNSYYCSGDFTNGPPNGSYCRYLSKWYWIR